MKNDAIVKAIEDDNFASFLDLLYKVDDFNKPAMNGMTPLIASIHFDRFSMFLSLVNHKKVDKNATDKDGYDAMYHAVAQDRFVYQLSL